jgi:hypothetical protein
MEQDPLSKRLYRRLDELLIFLIDFGFDFFRALAIFGVFLLFAGVIGFARTSGWWNKEQYEAFEVAHSRLNIAIFVIVCFALVFRIGSGFWKHKSGFKEVFKKSSRNFGIFFVEFSFDTLKGLTVFAAFLCFAWLVILAKAHGWGSEEEFNTYEFVLFWANYPLFYAIGFVFLLRTAKALWDELK